MQLELSPYAAQTAEILRDHTGLDGVYLVGGCVRDALLGLDSHDLDFALEKDSLKAARAVADALGGAYYTMDADFQVGRVVFKNAAGHRQIMDFAAMQGGTLEEDLRNRDFTVNAIAIPLGDLGTLVDPLGGAGDLFSKRLKACSPTSFVQDPVRVLRAVRMAAAYQLAFDPETRSLVEPAVALLKNVSIERQRDEFLKILDAPHPDTNLRILDRFGVLEKLIPEVRALKGEQQSPPHVYDVWDHSLHTVGKMEKLLTLLERNYVHDNEFGGDLVSGILSQRLGRFRGQISDYVTEELVSERTFRPLMFLAALLHDITKPAHRTVSETSKIQFIGHELSGARVFADRAAALRLSNLEIRRVRWMIEGHDRPWQMSKQPLPLSRKTIYQFWNTYGDAGVGICLLSLADTLAVYDHTITAEVLSPRVEVVRTLLEAYWEHHEQVQPPLLLDGNEIMSLLNLPPGPQVGGLLDALREAQAVGDVQDREQALSFIKDKLTDL